MRQLLRNRTWCVLLIFSAALFGQLEQSASADYSGVVSAKAVKYLDVLRKRPEPGYLFDRFYNTWLDEATVEDLQAYLTAQAAESKSTADQLLLAFFHAKQGDDVAALEEFRRALATDPASALTWYQKAAVEARTLDFETAIADLRKARDAKPDEKLAVLIDKLLGKLLVRNEQMEEAAKVWSELRAAHPQDQDLAEDLIELHIDEGLYKQAAELNEALIKETDDPYLAVTRRLRLGDIHYRAGDRAKALEAYSTSLDDVGADTWLEQEILAQTEQLFRREDDLAKLKAHYDELLKQHPKRIALHRKYAKLLVELGEQDAAIAAYKRILELTPGDRTNREEYVEMLAKIGKRDEAIAELTALCSQHPEDAELRFRLATLYHDAGKKEDATKAVTEYLAASDKSEYAYLRAARLLERFDLKDAAEGVYREMVETFKDSPSTQEAYAVFLYSREKKDEAIALWRKLAEGADLTQSLHVARALAARGEDAVALELLKSREADFAKEPLYYSQMATAALALKEPAQAVPWVQRRVELATQVPELEAALDQAKLVCDRADQVESLAAELEKAPRRSVQQTCLLAELLELAGDSEKADAALAKLADEGNVLAVSEQIRLHTERRDWTAAADATRRMLELPGGRKSIHVRRLVELCQRDFQITEALKWIDEWKKLSPGSTSPWTAEAGLLRLEGKDDAALAVLKSAAQKFEADEDLRLRLAQTYSETEHYGDAERIYWQLYDDTEDVSGKLRWAQELAKLAEQQGKVSQLVENFEERRRSNRQSIVPLLALSEVHRVADNYEGRRQALTAAAKIKPDDLELLHQIARIEEQEGDWNEAIATLERAVELDKTNRTRERIAQLHISFGNPDDGFAILFELAGAEKADPRTLEAIADAMCGLQEWERAADFLSQRIAEHPADYRLRYLLATAAEEADRIDEATAQFLELLEGQEELAASAKKNQAANQMNSHYEIIARIAPPKVLDWMQFSQYQHTAYSHRQQQGSYGLRYSGAGGASGGVVQMPPQVDAVRPMALAHLVTIAQTLEEDGAEQLVGSLQQRGVDEAKILIRMGADQGNAVNALPELLEENPDNEFALAITVLYQTGQRNPELAKHGIAAAEKFREKYPELAMMAALQAGAFEESQRVEEESPEEADKPKANKWLDEALAMAEKFDDPNPMLVMSVSSLLAGRPFNSEPLALEEGYRTKLSKLLLKWYPSMQQNPIYGQWAFFSVLGALTRGEDPSAYIAFLEDEVARWQKDGGRRNAQNPMFGSHQPQEFLAPMTFPPNKLADFPDNVLALLQPADGNNPMVSMYGQSIETEFNEEKLTAAINKVRDPMLRLLLANRFEKTELVDKLLEEMLGAKQPRLDAFLLAAAKASADEKYAEAVDLLAKARFLPMHRDIRSRVDASIVAAVLAAKLDSEKPPSEKVTEAGRAACLRLRQGRLDANNRTELIAAMEELGLKKEAAKLDRIASAQGASSPSTGSVMIARATPTTASKDRVAELIADGKVDAAVKLVTNEVLGHARQMLANPHNASYMRYQAREIKQRLDALDLTDKVIESLDPGDSDNTRRLSEYALACEMFNMYDKARAAYERLVEKRPKDDAMRFRLIMLLVPADPAAAEAQLAKLSPASSATMGQMMQQQMQDYEMPVDERVAVAEVAAKYLQSLAGDEKANATWSVGLVQMLASHMHTNRGESLPSLYAKKSDQKVAKSQAKVIERRRAAHRDLCEQMLQWPGAAKAGFSHLLGAAEAQGEVGEEFPMRAEEVLRLEAEPKGRNLVAHGQYYYNTSNSAEVRLQTPEEYLVRTAAAKNDWAHLDDNLLPELAQAKDKTPHKQLETLMALYRSKPEEFVAAAEKAVKSGGTAVGQMNDGSELNVIVSAWSDRKLEVDLEPLVLDRLKKISKGQNHHQAPACLPALIKTTRELRGNAAALALMEKIAEIYLGPLDKREAFLKRYNTNQGISYGQPTGQVYVYGQFMGQLIQQQELALLALKHLQDSSGSASLDNIEHYSSSSVNNLAHKPIKDVMAVISDSPWTADLDGFSPLNVGAMNQGVNSWLEYFLDQFQNNESRRKEFAAAIAEQLKSKPTFGLGIIDASLRGEKELAEFLATQMDAISALPEPRQLEIASFVDCVGGLALVAAAAERDDLAAVHKWLEGSGNRKSQELLETARKAKRLEDLGGHTYQAVENFGGQMKILVATDQEAARELFFRYVELSEDAVKRGQWQMYFGDGTSTPGYLLRTVAQKAQSDDMSLLPLLVDVVKNDRDVAIEYGDGPRNAVNNILRQRYEAALVNQKAPPIEALQKLYAEVGATLGERPASLFVESFYDVCTQRLHDKKLQLEMAAWLKSEAASKEHPQLAADFRAVLTLMRLERAAGKEEALSEISAEDREQCFGRFAELMAEEQLPLSWRLLAAACVVQHAGEQLPPKLGKGALGLFTAAIDGGTPLTSEQHRTLVRWIAKHQDSPELQESMAAWREQWGKRFLRPAGSGNASQQAQNNRVHDADILCKALAMYIKAGDEDRVNLLLRHYDDQLASMPTVIALLLRADKPDLAARFIRSHWAEISIDWPVEEATVYDETIQSREGALSEKLQRDDERFFAKTLLASMPTAGVKPQANQDGAASADPARDERLTKLAQEFASVEFKDDSFKLRTLTLLSRNTPASAVLVDALTEQYHKLNLPLSFQQDDSRRWQLESELAARHFTNQFRQGEYKDFVEVFDKLVTSIDPNNPYNFSHKIEPLINCCFESLRADGDKWTSEQCTAVGKSLRGLLVDQNQLHLNNFLTYNNMLFITHVRSGDTPALKKWADDLGGNSRSWVSSPGLGQRVWTTLRKVVGEPTPKNLAERQEAVEAAIVCASQQRWLIFTQGKPHWLRGFDQSPVFKHVVAAKLLSKEEVLAYASSTEAAADRPHMVEVTLAEWLRGEKKHREAAERFEQCVAKAPETWKLRKINWQLDAAAEWAHAGEFDKARKLAEEAAAGKTRDAEKQRIKRVQKLIEERQAAKEPGQEAPQADQKATAVPTTSARLWESPRSLPGRTTPRFAAAV